MSQMALRRSRGGAPESGRLPPAIGGFVNDGLLNRAPWPTNHHGAGPPGPIERNLGTMKVWIDQDLCTGDGLCEEIAPDVFAMLDDGLAYVKDGDKILSDPGGAAGLAPIPAGQEEATIESAEECPGECIYIEID